LHYNSDLSRRFRLTERNFYITKLREMRNRLQLPRGKNRGKFNGMAPSRGHNSASGDLLGLKLTEGIEQKLRKTMLALFGHQAGFTVTRIKRLKAIFTKQHFSKKE